MWEVVQADSDSWLQCKSMALLRGMDGLIPIYNCRADLQIMLFARGGGADSDSQSAVFLVWELSHAFHI